jgi:metallo-beta-lactamase class B
MKANRVILLSLLVPIATAARRTELKADPPKACEFCAAWNVAQEPFRVFGNTYYVGVAGLSSVLIASDKGLILLDGGLPQSAPLIDASICKLGLRTENVRLIVNSHAHYDHCGGIAALQRASGAIVAASASGARAIESGKPTADDPQYAFGNDANGFPPVKHVNVVADGEALRVGDLAITAHLTPGHTPGLSCRPFPNRPRTSGTTRWPRGLVSSACDKRSFSDVIPSTSLKPWHESSKNTRA